MNHPQDMLLHPSIPNRCDHGDFQIPSSSKRGVTVGAGQSETRIDPDEYASGVASPYGGGMILTDRFEAGD